MFIDALETRFPGAIEKADDAFGLQTIRVAVTKATRSLNTCAMTRNPNSTF